MTAEIPQETRKDRLRQAYLQGFDDGRGGTELSGWSEQTAQKQFERWYAQHYGESQAD